VNANAGSFLSRDRQRGRAAFLGLRKSLRQTVRKTTMDYMIAGLAAVGLFVYLIYALLKPERF
jgi:K+-transporting ATPase KdpF subunit